MPYYRDVTELAERVSLWADLRHEQRANLDPILRRARSELKRAIRELARLPEGKRSEKSEPGSGMKALRDSTVAFKSAASSSLVVSGVPAVVSLNTVQRN